MPATKIDTVEDLIRILDERPEWLEALRARLLTRELLELPQRLAEFIEATNQRFDSVERELRELSQRLAEFIEATNQRFDRVEERLDRVEGRLDRMEGRLDRVEGRLGKLTDDVGNLKGAHAKSVAKEEADIIANSLGLRLTRLLSGQEVGELALAQNAAADIPKNELLSFRRADIVMEAADADGGLCYVAVEVSYTVNGRDTTRAVRNADMLTRFTGKPARAVVAGIQIDDRVRSDVESGAIFWHEMVEDAVQAD